MPYQGVIASTVLSPAAPVARAARVSAKVKFPRLLAVSMVIMTSMSAYGQSVLKLPPQNFPWKLEERDDTVTSYFNIRGKGYYTLAILFHVDTSADLQEVKAFLGDGGYGFRSDNTSDAKRLIIGKDGSINDLDNMANEGKIVRFLVHPGTRIRIDVQIFRADASASPMLHRTINTEGLSGYLPGVQYRTLWEPMLEPGDYRIKAYALDLPPFPRGVRASLAVLPPTRY